MSLTPCVSQKGDGLLVRLGQAKAAPDIVKCYRCIVKYLTDSSSLESSVRSGRNKKPRSPVHVPFLIKYLKVSFQRLSEFEGVPELGSLEAIVQHITLAIKSLQELRAHLTGRRIELEIQRHTLVCTLISYHQYDVAARQGMELHRDICQMWGAQSAHKQTPTRQCNQFECLSALPLPGKSEASEAISVVVGNTCNLLLCALQAPEKLAALQLLQNMVSIQSSLEPWLRCVPTGLLLCKRCFGRFAAFLYTM
jgi:hypothetical protein